MKTSLFCHACQKAFIPDPRHIHHQRFCLSHSCQCARRRQNQRLRRGRAYRDPSPSAIGLPAGRRGITSEAAVKPYEAALSQFHPVIIGLISLFTDSTAQEDIVAFIRRCAARGQDKGQNHAKLNDRRLGLRRLLVIDNNRKYLHTNDSSAR